MHNTIQKSTDSIAHSQQIQPSFGVKRWPRIFIKDWIVISQALMFRYSLIVTEGNIHLLPIYQPCLQPYSFSSVFSTIRSDSLSHSCAPICHDLFRTSALTYKPKRNVLHVNDFTHKGKVFISHMVGQWGWKSYLLTISHGRERWMLEWFTTCITHFLWKRFSSPLHLRMKKTTNINFVDEKILTNLLNINN